MVVTYTSKTKVNDSLLVSPLAGGYIGDAVVTSVSARLQLKNNVNQGKVQSEEIAPSFGDIMTVYRRIYTAPFTALWQKRSLFVDVNYTLLPDLITHSLVDVLAVPDESIVPIIDNENGKILSTEALEVNVGIGDAYDSTKTYNESTMGSWEIRLIQKPTWNSVTEVAPWVKADGAGHASFALNVADLAGKNLRVFAEARIISPVPEYTVTPAVALGWLVHTLKEYHVDEFTISVLSVLERTILMVDCALFLSHLAFTALSAFKEMKDGE